ncbi:MAG: hypothetical protein GW854_01635 [Erythrobacter sp.]|nr:hypothetical protein [Erythrobacter sp.]
MSIMNLDPLSMDLIHQGRAVLVEVIASGTAAEREEHLGNVTVAENEMEAETTKVYSSNFPTRRQIGALSNETGMTFSFTTQSISREIRAMATMGLQSLMELPAVPDFQKEVGQLVVGDRIPLGRRVTSVEIGELEPGVDFTMVERGEVVLIRNVPAGTPATNLITGIAPAVTGGMRIAMGQAANRQVHLRLYGIEEGKEPFVMDIPQGTIRPSGAMGWIGENDPMDAEFSVEVEAGPDGSFGTIRIG